MHACLQASRATAYQGEIISVKTDNCSSSEGTRARAGPRNDAAGGDAMSVMEFNIASALNPAMIGNSRENTSVHPSIGRWKPNTISRVPLHPSVGSFKRDGVNLFDFECASCPSLEGQTSERKPVSWQQQCRGPALPGARTSML